MYLTLSHLRRNQVAQMVAHLTGGKTLPATVLDHILTKTDGVLLFVEEMTNGAGVRAAAGARGPLQ
jgi:predicted ATPase